MAFNTKSHQFPCMWNHQNLSRIDFRTIPILLVLMCISILVISATTADIHEGGSDAFLTPMAKSQLKWYGIGWVVYLFFAGFDYHKLREWRWVLYGIIIILLVGLFFVAPIRNVHRWYRVPLLGMALQPSDPAKLVVVITLSAFLEKKGAEMRNFLPTLQAILIVFIPFLLILKQPDLGTSLVLYPIALVMFYFGGVKRRVIFTMTVGAICALVFVQLMFLNILSHEEMRPIATKVIKEYQYERLNPDTYHQQAAQTALALGGLGEAAGEKANLPDAIGCRRPIQIRSLLPLAKSLE